MATDKKVLGVYVHPEEKSVIAEAASRERKSAGGFLRDAGIEKAKRKHGLEVVWTNPEELGAE